MKANPIISIITVLFNGQEFIERTIKSVLNQTYTNIEYLIIDGKSDDNSIDIIQQYEKDINYWISEPDKGISDAFNKGIQASKGDYILMLNAGDVLASPTLLKEYSSQFQNHDFIVFHTQAIGSKRFIGIDTYTNKNLKQKARLPHQGTFVHRDIYKKFGLYNLNYKIRMDYDFFLRVTHNNTLFIHKTLSFYDDTGISGQLKYRYLYEKEAIISEYKHLKKSRFYLLELYYKPLFMTIASWIKRTLLKIK